MSGLCGWIVPGDGTLARRDMDAFAAGLSFRSPEGVRVVVRGAAGLALGRMRTGRRSTMDVVGRDDVWIAADARIDARSTLQQALSSAGRKAPSNACDGELILEAYLAWGERCLDHLLGDYASSIWDARRRALFCARDPFGVK